MESTYSTLAKYLTEKISNLSLENRFLIAIAGIPGSGKTTLAKNLEGYVNNFVGKQVAISVSMDGYHYPRKILDTFPNVEEAYSRRGAHWTFDAEGLYLHLKEPQIWKSIAVQMNELWFLQVDREIARKRIIKRHIESGISNDEEAAVYRADNNDFLNADYILENSIIPTKTINSIEIDS
ncbi:12828_t:CDS:2 [Rhizophagus irregularis]|nr:12828_t:CDS:2 [Rhizophagus irregularis]